MNKRTLLTAATAAFFSLALALNAADEPKKKGPSFEDMDANKDGKVSKKEYMDANKSNAKAGDRFAALDADKDGNLTKAEMQAGSKKKKQ